MFAIILIIAMVIPIAGLFLSFIYFNSYKRPVLAAVLCGIAFSAALYGYIPDAGNDIFRHLEKLLLYTDVPFYDVFDLIKKDATNVSSVYTWNFWLWMISNFNNVYLLQSSGAFIGYTLISYMVFSQAKQNNLLMKEWLPFYGIAMLSFPVLEIAIGIRSANAFILFTLACYLYYFKKKSKFLVCFLLIISLFLHHGAIVPISAWLFLPLLNRYKKLTILFLLLVFIGFYEYQGKIILLIGDDFSSSGIISNSFYTASVYSQSNFNNSFHAVVSMVWRLGFSVLLFVLAEKENLHLKKTNIDNINSKILNFSLLILLISFGLVVIIGNNSLRYIGVVNLLCCLVLEKNSNNYRMEERKFTILPKLSLLIGSLGCFALYLYDMSWGTGSLESFGLSVLTGYLSRSL